MLQQQLRSWRQLAYLFRFLPEQCCLGVLIFKDAQSGGSNLDLLHDMLPAQPSRLC